MGPGLKHRACRTECRCLQGREGRKPSILVEGSETARELGSVFLLPLSKKRVGFKMYTMENAVRLSFPGSREVGLHYLRRGVEDVGHLLYVKYSSHD